MKVLILEDSPERIRTFKQKLRAHDLYFFDNVREACEAVDLLGPFDSYFLDHDLDGKVFVPSEEPNTGYQFAKYLAAKGVKGQVVVHTLNPAGADAIMSVLPTATRVIHQPLHVIVL